MLTKIVNVRLRQVGWFNFPDYLFFLQIKLLSFSDGFFLILLGFSQRRCEDVYNTSVCMKLADKLECYRNASFMTAFCRKTCNFCYSDDISSIQEPVLNV